MKNLSYYNRRLRIALVILMAVVACLEGQGWAVVAVAILYLSAKTVFNHRAAQAPLTH